MAQAHSQQLARGKHKAKGWIHWISKWPLLVYRLHLGWLLGYRFMRVTHRGRHSGNVYQTGVMVLRYDPRTREVFVAAGSKNADWYRNICTSPVVEVAIGRERYQPAQRLLKAEEIAELLAWSRRAHPFEARMQCLFFGWRWTNSEVELRELARTLGGVAFQLAANPD